MSSIVTARQPSQPLERQPTDIELLQAKARAIAQGVGTYYARFVPLDNRGDFASAIAADIVGRAEQIIPFWVEKNYALNGSFLTLVFDLHSSSNQVTRTVLEQSGLSRLYFEENMPRHGLEVSFEKATFEFKDFKLVVFPNEPEPPGPKLAVQSISSRLTSPTAVELCKHDFAKAFPRILGEKLTDLTSESEIDEDGLERIACRLIEDIRLHPLNYRDITTLGNDPNGEDFQKYVDNRTKNLKFLAAVGIKVIASVSRSDSIAE